MLIKKKAEKKWLKDERQLDDKRSDHPAKEFGHEPLIFDMGYQPGHVESDLEVINRLMGKLASRGAGSYCASSNGRGKIIRVEKADLDWFVVTIKQDGEVVQEGPIEGIRRSS